MTKLLAIDWGGKRVGLAIADTTTRLPRELVTLTNNDQLIKQLIAICAQETINLILVGLPLGMEGQATAQTRQVRQWAQQLKPRLGLPVKFQAETLTTQAARDQHATDLDSAAAVIMLQDYLAEYE